MLEPLPFEGKEIAIITGSTQANDDVRKHAVYAREYNRDYAATNGYSFFSEDFSQQEYQLEGRALTWRKIVALTKLLPLYRYVLWIDDDAIFLNKEMKIESIISLDEEADIIICKDISPASAINAGVFIVKNSEWSRNTFIELLTHERYKEFYNKPYHEQASLEMLLDEEITNSFQDIHYGRYSKVLREGYPVRTEHFLLLPTKVMNGIESPFVRHLAGWNDRDREKDFRPSNKRDRRVSCRGVIPWHFADKALVKRRIQPTIADETSLLIPKVINQTFESTVIPSILLPPISSWVKNNEEYLYRYHTTSDQRSFIRKHFDKEVLQAYDDLIPGAYKADLWRYCLLYVEGGWYADIKTVCEVKLLDIDNVDMVLTLDRHYKERNTLHNAFMASVPKSPLIKATIDQVVEKVKRRDYGTSTLEITGPDALGKAVFSLLPDLPKTAGIHKTKYGNILLLQLRGNDVIDHTKKIFFRTRPRDRSIERNIHLFELATGILPYGKMWEKRSVQKVDV